jgi:N-acetyl sugar amidotransferase
MHYQQCTRCVMDTTDPDIQFNSAGQCNHCTTYLTELLPQTYQGIETERLRASIIRKIKKAGENKPYDCIIGISGGVDSCYTAYLAKEMGLHPLLLHLDNGWDSDVAVGNIKKVADKLDLDYESYVLNWQEFKEIQLAFLRSSIVDLEIPTDIAIPAVLHQTAAKYGIHYILSGGNYSSEGILPKQWGYHVMKDMKLYRYIVKKYSSVPLKTIPTFGVWRETYYKLIKGIRTIYLLNYFPYNKDEAQAFLEKEFGCMYTGGKHHESRYTSFWQGYIMPTKYHFDYRLATLSTQICVGQLTRDAALTQLEKPAFDTEKIASEKVYVCKKLGIERSELEQIMLEKPLTYKNFPNSENRLLIIFKIYQWLFPKKRI